MTHLEKALIPLAGVAVMMAVVFFTADVQAQHQQVRCINIMDGETIQIFNQMNCPRGWAPI